MNKNILVHIVGILLCIIAPLRGMQQVVVEQNVVSEIELACTNNDTKEVKRLLALGVRVNEVNHQGVTLLYAASQLGHKTITQLLLSYGADVNAQSPDGGTALHAASMNNHAEVCQILISNNAQIDRQTHSGATPLFIAVLRDSYDAASVLLRHNADPNVATLKNEKTPLHRAVEDGNTRMTNLLLAHGADASSPDKQGDTPFFLAAQGANKAIGQKLIEFHANCKGSGFYLSKKNRLLRKFLKVLQQRQNAFAEEGGDLDAQQAPSASQNTTGAAAVNNPPYQNLPPQVKNHYDTVSVPLTNSNRPRVPSQYDGVHVRQQDGYDAAVFSQESENTANGHYCSVLHQRQPENSNDSYLTLHKAAAEGSCEDIEILLSVQVPVDLRDDAGYTPLQRGVMAGKENSCRLLLAHKADRSLKTPDGKTAIMLARELGFAQLVTLLESAPVKNSARYGYVPQVPSGYAAIPESAFKLGSGYVQLPAAFIIATQASTQAKVDEKRYVSIPLIHKAAHEGICEIIEMHLNLKVPIDLFDDEGYTPLHRAAMANQGNASKLLLSKGAQRALRTKAGKTAQMIAQEQGFKELAALLGNATQSKQ